MFIATNGTRWFVERFISISSEIRSGESVRWVAGQVIAKSFAYTSGYAHVGGRGAEKWNVNRFEFDGRGRALRRHSHHIRFRTFHKCSGERCSFTYSGHPYSECYNSPLEILCSLNPQDQLWRIIILWNIAERRRNDMQMCFAWMRIFPFPKLGEIFCKKGKKGREWK